MKKWAKNYEELILKSTEYSGSREPNAKILSASSINKENYYLMNQYNFEKKKQDSFGANTIGSIFQLGIDAAIQKHDKEGRYEFGRRMSLQLDNGWTISGELDVFDKIDVSSITPSISEYCRMRSVVSITLLSPRISNAPKFRSAAATGDMTTCTLTTSETFKPVFAICFNLRCGCRWCSPGQPKGC